MKTKTESLALITPMGFIQEFFNNLPVSKTYKEAYELAELKHVRKYGFRKYKNYNSFQTNKKRILNKRK